ncbi:MAG TPA: D-alanyl-D-alanine carboxypeptidase/D-alanyl-D-alanine-endopeptidase [Gemmatimonadaceae bacterium]|nr:D-alanyl-D-alanine carboxypeptidase/D-alanyl-D-alanine-endopeptidase [Gemmatimonadaceae bacterium]
MIARLLCATGAAALLGCAGATPAPTPAPTVRRTTTLSELRRQIDSMVALPEFRNAHWGILIVDPDRGDTLYSHNAGKLFMPASNMKVITGSVALAQLGPEFRFRTTFVARGGVCGGVLHGDLVVNGRGDPSVSDAMRGDAMVPMREIADSLAAHGITRIAGKIVAGENVFPDSSLGYGWSWDDLRDAYSAGVDELFFDEGYGRVVVRGGAQPGAPVTVAALPSSRYPVVRVEARTALAPDSGAVGSGGRLVMSRESQLETHVDPASGAEVLSGWIAPQWVDTLDVVYPDQNAAYLAALGQALSERGIVVTGALSPAGCGASGAASTVPTTAQRLEGGAGATAGRDTTATTPMDTIFVYQSLPLRDILRAMAKPSQNQIAEILLKTIGLERTGVGRADSGSAVVARQLLAWGAQPDGFVLRDGSGLSRYDYLTPETLVHTLAAIRHDTAFAAFYDALPIAGVDGTIAGRMRGTPAQGNVHAKTGYVANARSLSGYVTTADGRMLIFSALCNNWTVPVRDVERVQDSVAVGLASLRLDEGR